MRVREYPQQTRSHDLKAHWRKASYRVIETTREMKAAMGDTPILHYEQNTGAQGPQNAGMDHNLFFVSIDYIVDVYNTGEKVLDSNAQSTFIRLLDHPDADLTIIREEHLPMHETLGRAFIGRQLYPTKAYFRRFKR
jgi:hypothetical protein